jgi:hypothetical protein
MELDEQLNEELNNNEMFQKLSQQQKEEIIL